MPEFKIWGSIQLVHEPSIPVCLINGLDRYADALQESQLDQAHLEWAKRDVEYAINRVSIDKIRAEDSVLPFFQHVVANPVEYLCRALGLEVEYAGGPRIENLNPDHAWLVADQVIAIFEHKTPCVAGRHFPKIVTAAKEQVILNVQTPSNNAASILSKVGMPRNRLTLDTSDPSCCFRVVDSDVSFRET
ncbi:hypothetical protein M407DRAFT_31221 [Tulasnella calospora MUT 4182]|uniref:Uncharacterized protein n=1 Tax=Tulasnella calospora MUT 4182 TaxID=1051891 RepID=A0A0C3KCF2_9AGAM|nr:hypothetical protein M407DRAFT_31221 [Tulasnella calospora MUT 4182]